MNKNDLKAKHLRPSGGI